MHKRNENVNPCVAFTTQRNFFASPPLLFLPSFSRSAPPLLFLSPSPATVVARDYRGSVFGSHTDADTDTHSLTHTPSHAHTHIRAPRSIWLGHFFCYCAGNASLSSSNLLCVVCGSPQEGVASLCAGRGGRQLRNILISSSGFCERHFRRKK